MAISTSFLEVVPVNLDVHLDLCVAFRKDAYCISYGSEQGFSARETSAWFYKIAAENPAGFKHVLINNEIAGQLEFKSPIDSDTGKTIGYVNLFYLREQFRRRGFGQQLHEYVIQQFRQQGCLEANLRYIPGNISAEQFYFKNGWVCVGKPGTRGQLMVKKLV